MNEWRTDIENIPEETIVLVRMSDAKYHTATKHSNQLVVVANRFLWDYKPIVITHWKFIDFACGDLDIFVQFLFRKKGVFSQNYFLYLNNDFQTFKQDDDTYKTLFKNEKNEDLLEIIMVDKEIKIFYHHLENGEILSTQEIKIENFEYDKEDWFK